MHHKRIPCCPTIQTRDGERSDQLNAFHVGSMTKICQYCSAKLYKNERKGLCCKDGKVILPQANPLPPFLDSLYRTNLDFVRDIRKYNQAFAFTSLGAKVDESLANATSGVYTFRINGMLSHRIGGLLPDENNLPKFAQIYFTGDQEQPALRNGHFGNQLDEHLLTDIQRLLIRHNPYVQIFRQAREFSSSPTLELKIRNSGNLDNRRYNIPTVDEVAAIIVDQDGGRQCRDLIIHKKNGRFQRIKESSQVFTILLICRPMMPFRTPYCFHMEKWVGTLGWRLLADQTPEPNSLAPIL